MTDDKMKPEIGLRVLKEEMNLPEIPLGPITSGDAHSFEVRHDVYDRILKRRVTRATVITGCRLFGLPRPIDDQALIGMQALTYESGYSSRKVYFSRYHLCQILGWSLDGRSYRRLGESFDRIAGTTLKSTDAWYDKGNREWLSKTFHLIEEVRLSSRDQLDRVRLASGKTAQKLNSFTWSDTLWKSFADGWLKSIDMTMYRSIAKGRRREVPLRLFRLLDKRFHRSSHVRFDLESLCVGKLGLSPNYGPSQMLRIITRAADWLTECGYLRGFKAVDGMSHRSLVSTNRRHHQVIFYKRSNTRRRSSASIRTPSPLVDVKPETRVEPDELELWLARHSEQCLIRWEEQALQTQFGSLLERNVVEEVRRNQGSIHLSGRIRQEFVRKYVLQTNPQLST